MICFDFLNATIEKYAEFVNNIHDIDFLKILQDVEKDGQNRKQIFEIIEKQIQKTLIEEKGFRLEIFKKLLIDVPFYRDGIKKEPLNEQRIKEILDRDGHRCQICFASTDLVCHHIDPQGSIDPDNLITLCKRCHMAIHYLLKAKGYHFYIQKHYW